MKEFNSYEEFLVSFNNNPLETIKLINSNRLHSDKKWLNESALKMLEEKINKGSTLKDFYELITFDKEKMFINYLTLG